SMRKSEYRGYIDTAMATFATGWAADFSDLDRAVDVEIFADRDLVATVPANRHRNDLLHAGVGDGCHGFEAHVPSPTGKLYWKIRARVRGSNSFLRCGDSGRLSMRVDNRVFLRRIALDIVNNCNLRCPFCLVDYSDVRKTELMTTETFAKLLPLV